MPQCVAGPLTLAGWPLLCSAGLVALSAGLVNHALANGLLNGILCAEFYWTVSLMFALSNSVLPVGLYHHLMYSMPTFVTSYDEAIEAAPSPVAQAALLHGALMTWHLAAFALVARLGTPVALPLQPPLPDWPTVPATPSAYFGLGCVALFAALIAGVVSDLLAPKDFE